MSRSNEIDIELHPRQTAAFESQATEILYGGAAGGGKSHLMRCAAVIWCAEIPGLQAYLFRRLSPDLTKNHMEGPAGFRSLLAGWVDAKFVTIVEDEIRFWNGSKIYLCHCKDEKDRYKYQGSEIHLLLIDELTHFTDTIYRFLRGRVRAVGLKLPDKYKGRFPRILCGSNPGNIGHHWVKAAFIDNVEPMSTRRMGDEEGGMLRQYIPAKLDDNPSMAEHDPTYRARLRGLGSEALVRAMEDGDWNIIEGAFFTEFSPDRHVLKPVSLPPEWIRFRAMDWGSAKPFSVGWYAVSDGILPEFPRGALIKYREWYGMRENQPNTGLKMTAEEVADGILAREREGERIDYGVADPAIFTADGGPSIAERQFSRGVVWRRADNARVARSGGAIGGWDQLRSRLRGDGEKPMLYFFQSCVHTIRTLPALQHDPDRPEDVDTDMEDHAPDETRYACMSRPWVPARPEITPACYPQQMTINELIARNARRNSE